MVMSGTQLLCRAKGHFPSSSFSEIQAKTHEGGGFPSLLTLLGRGTCRYLPVELVLGGKGLATVQLGAVVGPLLRMGKCVSSQLVHVREGGLR